MRNGDFHRGRTGGAKPSGRTPLLGRCVEEGAPSPPADEASLARGRVADLDPADVPHSLKPGCSPSTPARARERPGDRPPGVPWDSMRRHLDCKRGGTFAPRNVGSGVEMVCPCGVVYRRLPDGSWSRVE